MSKSPRRDLGVFDFNEHDDVAEIAAAKYLSRSQSPSPDVQPVTNGDFLGDVSQVDIVGVKYISGTACINVDADGGNFDLENGVSELDVDADAGNLNVDKGVLEPPLDTVVDVFDNKEKNSELEPANQSNSSSHENHLHFKVDIDKYKEPETEDTNGGLCSPQTSQMDIAPSGSPSSSESVDVNSEADECVNENDPSSSASDIAENVSLNGYGWNDCLGNFDVDDAAMEVILHPDYVIYRDNYYMGPKLTFSYGCIKINVSTTCIKQEEFDLEWAVDDLIDIRCQLFQSNGTVIIKLHVISSDASQSDHVSSISGESSISGIEELEIAVVDSNWSLRHKQITSLNMKYSAIWNIVLDTEVELTNSLGPRCYFPNFEDPFSEFVYPKGDPDAVSLSRRDVDLLRPDTFINDTIIDFYIQYLKKQIQQEERHRFHFFNSFFFRKLADMDKNPSSASDGRAAFLRVRKWTRKINLFEKDYIFVPVNFNLHWSLIVICHPGEVVGFNDKELDKSLKVPCILHMDSIKGSHSGLKNLIQSYLWEEWKERQKETLEEDLSSRFFNMRFLPLALPQQENSYDCGLFLLHYLELFLAEAPFNFNPFELTKFSNFLNVDWFLPAEAYLKRTLIQRLIFELVENPDSHEMASADSSDDHPYSKINENRPGNQCPKLNGESTTSHAGQGIEITLLSASASLDPQSFNNSGLVLKELFDPGTTTGAYLGQCQSFNQRSSDYRLNGSIFSMEEDTDLGEQFMYLATDTNFQQGAGITPQTCSLPYLPQDCGTGTRHKPDLSLQAEHDTAESSLDTSSGASYDSDDIDVIESYPTGKEAGSPNEAERGEEICLPMENTAHSTDITGCDGQNLPSPSVMGISQDSSTKCDDTENGDIDSSCQDTLAIPLHQVSDAVDDKAMGDNVQMIDDMTPDMDSSCQDTSAMPLHQASDAVENKAMGDDNQMIDDIAPDNDICEEQAAKRRRLMPLQCGGEGILSEFSL